MDTSKGSAATPAGQGAEPGPGPILRTHHLVVHAPNADVDALSTVARRLAEDALPPVQRATGAQWPADGGRVRALENEDPRTAVDFLDHALLEMVEGPADVVVVGTDAPSSPPGGRAYRGWPPHRPTSWSSRPPSSSRCRSATPCVPWTIRPCRGTGPPCSSTCSVTRSSSTTDRTARCGPSASTPTARGPRSWWPRPEEHAGRRSTSSAGTSGSPSCWRSSPAPSSAWVHSGCSSPHRNRGMVTAHVALTNSVITANTVIMMIGLMTIVASLGTMTGALDGSVHGRRLLREYGLFLDAP